MSELHAYPIACVVLNWNSGDLTEACLQSLYSSQGVRVEIFVVDNGSTDGSVERLASTFCDAEFIRLGENKGLAAARNAGVRVIREHGYRYALFIDNDARVEEHCLVTLLEVLCSDADAGIITPRILTTEPDSVIWYDGGGTDIFGRPFHRNMWKEKGWGVGAIKVQRSEFATGCCVLIKTEVFERVGDLDEGFFVYAEDADFSFRTRAAGFAVMHLPSALGWHGQSTDTKSNRGKWFRDYYVTRNNLFLFAKHYTGIRYATALVASLVLALAESLYFLLSFQSQRSRATLIGCIDFFRGRFGGRFT